MDPFGLIKRNPDYFKIRKPIDNIFTLRRGQYMNGVEAVRLCPSVAKNPKLHFLYGKTLPLFLSDIFLQSETKCRIFPDIVSGRDFCNFNFFEFKIFRIR